MSRFSQSEAESLGWVFVHDSAEEEVITSETQGISRLKPASVRAEKSLGGVGMINEEAESMGLLLERIHAYEEGQKARQIVQTPVAINEDNIPTIHLPAGDDHVNEGEDTGIPIRTVTLPSGERITEEELVSRSKQDALLLDGKMVFTGPLASIIEAEEERATASAEAENERGNAEDDLGDRESIFIDKSQTVTDLPGGATGSSLVVLEGEDPDTISESRQESKAIEENEKSLAAVLPVGEQAQAEAEAEEQPVDATTEPPEGEVFTESSTEATKPDVEEPIVQEDGGEPA
jgi:hypothetical protein